jgi:hypothetical protein
MPRRTTSRKNSIAEPTNSFRHIADSHFIQHNNKKPSQTTNIAKKKVDYKSESIAIMRIAQRQDRNSKHEADEEQIRLQQSKDNYEQKAKMFYATESIAVVESVYRKPKAFANLHEYDEGTIIDQVPTAIGFNSFDSAEEINLAKSKSRYEEYVSPKAVIIEEKRTEPETDSEAEEEVVKETREEAPSNESQAETPSEDTPLDEAPSDEIASVKKDPSYVTVEKEEKEEVEEFREAQEISDKQSEEIEEAVDSFDKYGLVNTTVSEDDSCPPIWKSFSEDSASSIDQNEKVNKKDSLKAAQRRREAALEEAKRKRALNSVIIPGVDSIETVDSMDSDPRIRRNQRKGRKKKFGLGIKSRSKKTKKGSKKAVAGKAEAYPKPSDVKKLEAVESQATIEEMKSFEINAKSSMETETSEDTNDSEETDKYETGSGDQEDTLLEETFASYIYSGLTTMNPCYWMAAEQVKDENSIRKDDSSDSHSTMSHEVMTLTLDVDTATFEKPELSTETPTMISVPSTKAQKKDEANKGSTMDENQVPQQMKKKRGFGKILGRRTKASN